MKCPNDDTVLQMTDRQGVEIDYCPTCRGVWLDRGELDKILERARSERGYDDDDDDRRYAGRAEQPRRDDWQSDRDRNPRGYEEQRQQSGYPSGQSGQYPPKKKKRGGFLEDLLDFG